MGVESPHNKTTEMLELGKWNRPNSTATDTGKLPADLRASTCARPMSSKSVLQSRPSCSQLIIHNHAFQVPTKNLSKAAALRESSISSIAEKQRLYQLQRAPHLQAHLVLTRSRTEQGTVAAVTCSLNEATLQPQKETSGFRVHPVHQVHLFASFLSSRALDKEGTLQLLWLRKGVSEVLLVLAVHEVVGFTPFFRQRHTERSTTLLLSISCTILLLPAASPVDIHQKQAE